MRILAIRGGNLASLAGRFEVDLTAGPLGRAGLYAITGATGAGKSTLLDALCLALYDRTPRLNERGGVAVGREEDDEKDRLASNDVRGVLRRGAAEGWAEVDFRGRDRRTYRARWSVRRARGRVDGRIQNQTLELLDLDTDAALGGTKTETLTAIEERLGLSFDQFRRSVLLAQGDFAAFLRAGEPERAELLEAMTGTDVYGRLSIAAHERARKERTALEELQAREEGLSLLSEDAREALTETLVVQTAAVDARRAEEAAARADVDWYGRLAQLVAAERAASVALADEERKWEESAPRRAELRAVEDAQRLRGTVERVDKASAAVEATTRTLEGRRKEAAATAADTGVAGRELEAARAQLRTAQRVLEEAQPVLDRAAALDTRIEDADRGFGAAERAAREAAAVAKAAETEAGAAAKRRAEQDTVRDDAARWLADRPQVAPLAADWPLWRAELERYREAARARRSAEEGLAAAERAIEERRGAHTRAAEARQEVADRLSKAEDTLRSATEAAAELDPAALADRREATRAQCDALAGMVRAGDEAAKAADGERKERELSERAARGADEAAARAVAAERDGAALGERVGEAERALETLQTALSLEARRGDLRDGEPCPLCGATAHPWAEEGAPGGAAVEGQRARVTELRTQRDDLTKAAAEASSRAGALRTSAAEAQERAAAWAATLASARASWAAARAALPAAGESAVGQTSAAAAGAAAADDPLAPGAVATAHDEQRAALERLAAVRGQEREADARAKAEKRARGAVEAARTAADGATKAARDAEDALRRAERAADDARGARDRAAADEERAIEAVAPAFGASQEPWRDRLRDDPEGFSRRCGRAVDEWQAQVARRDGAARALETLREEAGRLAVAAEQGARAAAEKGSTRDDARKALEALRAERRGLLDGRPTDEAGRALRDAVERARRTAEDAGIVHGDKEKAQARAETAAAEAAKALDEAQAERSAAREALDDALRGRGEDEGTLRQRLDFDDAWIRARQEGFARLETAVAHARGELTACRKQRESHEAAESRPARARADAESALTAARAGREEAEGAQQKTRLDLEVDDRARERASELLPRIEAQARRADLWTELGALIGSHDGKKYRTFAQSLTLEALLLEANDQLGELTDRYELVRVPGTELALQVIDRHMGDEVRAVNSLSGGESFLVSLALALGLSALSATGTRIESLFIDEGFGSLDPQTLDTALAVLDALQASGRQVGLISHVPGLAERIGVRVDVRREGAGRSTVHVVG